MRRPFAFFWVNGWETLNPQSALFIGSAGDFTELSMVEFPRQNVYDNWMPGAPGLALGTWETKDFNQRGIKD
jgi:hypothetical protein